MQIILIGQTPSQKNSKMVGRNKYTGKTFVTSNARVKEWQKDAHLQLTTQYKGCVDGRATIAYMFYVKDNTRRDIDNMIASCNDALVKAGLIKDDCWQYLSIGGADAEIDKKNPRAELWITED